jgi:uncharacterized protein YlxW (UPF0749 family)
VVEVVLGYAWEAALTIFMFTLSVLGTVLWKSFTRWMEAFDKKVDQLEKNDKSLADSDRELSKDLSQIQVQIAREFVSRVELDAKIDKLVAEQRSMRDFLETRTDKLMDAVMATKLNGSK